MLSEDGHWLDRVGGGHDGRRRIELDRRLEVGAENAEGDAHVLAVLTQAGGAGGSGAAGALDGDRHLGRAERGRTQVVDGQRPRLASGVTDLGADRAQDQRRYIAPVRARRSRPFVADLDPPHACPRRSHGGIGDEIGGRGDLHGSG